MEFLFNNSSKTTKLSKEQVKDILMNIYESFECIDYAYTNTSECKCKEILGFDCDDNDNHCPIKQILSDVMINYDE